MQADGEALAVAGGIVAALSATVGLLWRRCVHLEGDLRTSERERREHAEQQLAQVTEREAQQGELLERVEALVSAQTPKPYRPPMGSRGGR